MKADRDVNKSPEMSAPASSQLYPSNHAAIFVDSGAFYRQPQDYLLVGAEPTSSVSIALAHVIIT